MQGDPGGAFHDDGAVLGGEAAEGVVGEDTVFALVEDDPARTLELAGVEGVAVHDDALAPDDVEIVGVRREEDVPGEGDVGAVAQIDVQGDVAEDVAGDGDGVDGIDLLAEEADVRGAGGDLLVVLARVVRAVLDGAAGDGDLADGAALVAGGSRDVEEDVGGLRGRVVGGHVRLDVAAGDVEVAHVSVADDDAAAAVVADVRVGDVDLVEVHVVEVEADAAVLVEVHVGDGDVAVPQGETDAVAAPAHRDLGDDGLEGADELDAVGLGVVADDLDALDERHAFVPGGRLEGLRRGGAFVRADDADGGAGAVHDESRGTTGGPDDGAVLASEDHLERAGDAMDAGFEEEGAVAFLKPLAELLGSIRQAGEVGELRHGEGRLHRQKGEGKQGQKRKKNPHPPP